MLQAKELMKRIGVSGVKVTSCYNKDYLVT